MSQPLAEIDPLAAHSAPDATRRWGAACRGEWLLEPGIDFLNHGSFGAAPREVLAAQDAWRERLERRPCGFMGYELPQAVRAAATRLAGYLGARGEDLVFIENATAGCNAVLMSFPLAPGDEILLTNHGYAAVRNAARHAATRAGASVKEAAVPYPLREPEEIVAAVAAALGPRTRLVILDHVTSPTAVVFPAAELVALCKKAGAAVLVDGAHAPGMLALDVPAVGADWYVGNCHKWLMAPKGAGFLWAKPERQAGLHPPVISHGYETGFTAEFDWVGTRDPSSWLAVPAALDFHTRMGGAALRRRNRELVIAAADSLAEAWRTERGMSDPLTGSMATVRLPPSAGAATREAAMALRQTLDREAGIEVPVHAFAGALWARISAQAYNETEDYERLAARFAPAA
jgi:isopenicillin-N epimerase